MSSNIVAYIQVLGVGKDCVFPSLLLSIERKSKYSDESTVLKRYFFNAGEGLQRICSEYKIKLGKLETIFLTGLQPHQCGGIPGLIFTLSSLGTAQLEILGPHGLKQFVKSTESFCSRRFPAVNAEDLDDRDAIEDNFIATDIIVIQGHKINSSSSSDSSEEEEEEEDNSNKDNTNDDDTGNQNNKKRKRDSFSSEAFNDIDVICYKCRLKEGDRPTIIVISCPLISFLSIMKSHARLKSWFQQASIEAGSSPTYVFHMANHNIVCSDVYVEWINELKEVCKLSTNIKHIFITERLNSDDDCFILHKSFARSLVRLHALSPSTFSPPSYLNSNLQQSTTEPDTDNNTIGNFEQILCKNNTQVMMLPISKRKIIEEETVIEDVIDVNLLANEVSETLKNIYGQEELKLYEQFLQVSALSPISKEDDSKMNRDNFWNMHPGEDDIDVTFLGTGSAAPSKKRNASGILLNISNKSSSGITRCKILLDCGEGTYGQLVRIFGKRDSEDIIASLNCIWISHNHADHHMGIGKIIFEYYRIKIQANKQNRKVEKQQLLIIAPKSVLVFLDTWLTLAGLEADEIYYSITCQDYNNVFLNRNMKTIPTPTPIPMQRTTAPSWQTLPPFNPLRSPPQMYQNLGQNNFPPYPFQRLPPPLPPPLPPQLPPPLPPPLPPSLSPPAPPLISSLSSIISVPVYHCRDAFGVVLTLQSGKKVVYSGDCRPSEKLIKEGSGCHVLIHEATFDDDKQEDAVKKKHTTVGEALEVATRMKAKSTILTHFSQRYPSMIDRDGNADYCVAFDGMTINARHQLWIAPKLTKYMQAYFQYMDAKEKIKV